MHLCLAKSSSMAHMAATHGLSTCTQPAPVYLLLTCRYCRSVPDSHGISPISGIMICMKEEENTIPALEVEVEAVALCRLSS